MRILLIDNFDSFTYNLVHYLEEFEVEVRVVRNNLLEWEMLENIDGVVISPGPGLPEEAGLLLKFL
ncbi:MAG: glutamine amidotransferase-related protein, partial [Bacteroidota bacterium]